MAERTDRRLDLIRELRSLDADERRTGVPLGDRPVMGRHVSAVLPRIARRALRSACPVCGQGKLSASTYKPPADLYRRPGTVSRYRDDELRVLRCSRGCPSHLVMQSAAGWSPDGPTQPVAEPAAGDRPTREVKPPTPDIRRRNPRLHRA